MRRVGLTGGIGSGKSTVAGLLADRGAVVIDADAIAREVVEVGEPALEQITERFGDEVLQEDGSLDRAALAGIVFADAGERRALEAITHPAIGARIAQRYAEIAGRDADRGTDTMVVLDHPLLVETGVHDHQDRVIVVVAGEDLRVERLVGRGLEAEDARVRMRSQLTDDERRAVADHVVDNNGDLASLAVQVDGLWSALSQSVDQGIDSSVGGQADEADV